MKGTKKCPNKPTTAMCTSASSSMLISTAPAGFINQDAHIHWLALSIKPMRKKSNTFWEKEAISIIERIVNENALDSVFGALQPHAAKLSGCNTVYRLGSSECYFGYHSADPRTGVVLEIKGKATDQYQNKTGKDIIALFMALPNEEYQIDLSRIDFAHDIYSQESLIPRYRSLLKQKMIGVRHTVFCRSGMSYKRIWNPVRLPSDENIYLSRKSETMEKGIRIGARGGTCEFAAYDKTKEQAHRGNFKREHCDRFEARFRKGNAKFIGHLIEDTDSWEQAISRIALFYINKFEFFSTDTNEPIDLTQYLMRITAGESFTIFTPVSIKKLLPNLEFVFRTGGVILRKIYELYGDDCLTLLVDALYRYARRMELGNNSKQWVKDNVPIIRTSLPLVDDFIHTRITDPIITECILDVRKGGC